MERNALIELLIRNVQAGEDVGLYDDIGVYTDFTITKVHATLKTKEHGPRWPSSKAKTVIAVLHRYGNLPT